MQLLNVAVLALIAVCTHASNGVILNYLDAAFTASQPVYDRLTRSSEILAPWETLPPNTIRAEDVVGKIRQIIRPDTPEFDLIPPNENPLIEYPSSPVEGHLPKRMSIRLAQVLNDLAIAVSDLVFNDGNNLILEVREGYSVASSTDNPSLFHEGRQVDIVLRDKRNGNRLNNNNDVGILAYLAWKNRADWVQHRGWFVRIAVIPEGCGATLDLGFLLDGSGSLGAENWVDQLAFVKEVSSFFTIGWNDTRVGAVTFHGPRTSHLSYNASIPNCPKGTLWEPKGKGCICAVKDSECVGSKCDEGFFEDVQGSCTGITMETVTERANCRLVGFFPHSCQDCTCDPLGRKYKPHDSYTIDKLFSDTKDADTLNSIIDDLKYPNGATHTSRGLEQVRDTIFQLQNGMRPFEDSIPRVLVVLTDAKSNPGFEPDEIAKELHDRGIIVYAIGVGTYFYPELHALASEPKDQHIFQLESAHSLWTIVDRLSRDTCEISSLLSVGRRISLRLGRNEFRYFTAHCQKSTTKRMQPRVIVELVETSGNSYLHVSSRTVNPSALHSKASLGPKDGKTKVIVHDRTESGINGAVHVSVQGSASHSTNEAQLVIYNLLFKSFRVVYGVMENATIGTVVAGPAALVDEVDFDFEFDLVDPTGTFQVDETDGSITLVKDLDRDEVSVYHLKLWVIDSPHESTSCHISYQSITIDVADQHHGLPEFPEAVVHVDHPEDVRGRPDPDSTVDDLSYQDDAVGRVVTQVKAIVRGEEIDTAVYYEISGGNEFGLFNINSTTGVIYQTTFISYETLQNPIFELTIYGITEFGAVTNPPITVIVNITDQDDLPSFAQNPLDQIIFDAGTIGKVGRADVIDDASPNQFRCIIVTKSVPFSVESQDDGCDIIVTSSTFSNDSYTLHLQIVDDDGVLSNTVVGISVLPINEHAPRFANADDSIELYVTTSINTNVLEFDVTDDDGDAVSCKLKSAPKDLFRIEDCKLILNSHLLGHGPNMEIIVEATDAPTRGSRSRSATATIDVIVVMMCPTDDSSCPCMDEDQDPCHVDLCEAFPCENGATCHRTENIRTCLCPEAISGERCEITECSAEPCQNGGTCFVVPESPAGYECTCPSAYTGQTCENPTPCLGNDCTPDEFCVVNEETYHCVDSTTASGDGVPTVDYSIPPEDVIDDCSDCPEEATCVRNGDLLTCECPRITNQRGEQCYRDARCTELAPCSEVLYPRGDKEEHSSSTKQTESTTEHPVLTETVEDRFTVGPDCDCKNGGTCRTTSLGQQICLCPRVTED
eukprot:gene9343-1606_t